MRNKKGFVLFCLFIFFYNLQFSVSLSDYFENLNNLSPHPPKSFNHRAVKNYIINELKKSNASVKVDEFTYQNQILGYSKGYNIIAEFAGRKKEKIAFASHWDTRPIADNDLKYKNRNKPIIGANDGNSSTAVLLKLSEYLSRKKLEYTVVLLFFDAEDSGINGEGYCIGSKKYVENHDINFVYGILIDMIGDKNLTIKKEGFSKLYATKIVNNIWNIARQKFNYKFFKNSSWGNIIDDHYSFLKKGIPFVNIIDFDYIYWHTTKDIPENCSVANMRKIYRLLKYISANPGALLK